MQDKFDAHADGQDEDDEILPLAKCWAGDRNSVAQSYCPIIKQPSLPIGSSSTEFLCLSMRIAPFFAPMKSKFTAEWCLFGVCYRLRVENLLLMYGAGHLLLKEHFFDQFASTLWPPSQKPWKKSRTRPWRCARTAAMVWWAIMAPERPRWWRKSRPIASWGCHRTGKSEKKKAVSSENVIMYLLSSIIYHMNSYEVLTQLYYESVWSDGLWRTYIMIQSVV